MINKLFYSAIYIEVLLLIFEFLRPTAKCKKLERRIRGQLGNFLVFTICVLGLIKLWATL